MGHRRGGAIALAAVLALGAWGIAQQSDDPEVQANAYFEEFTEAPYTDWTLQPGAPEGYYVGIEPHGMILRTFVNDIAAEDVGSGAEEYSDGAVIVKENHMPGDVDVASMEQQAPVEDFDGNLASLTYMVKVEGYNPDAGDWFWAKQAPDGSIDAAGTPDGCISCHAQVEDNDYVFNSPLAGSD